jgi:hypothetical protein
VPPRCRPLAEGFISAAPPSSGFAGGLIKVLVSSPIWPGCYSLRDIFRYDTSHASSHAGQHKLRHCKHVGEPSPTPQPTDPVVEFGGVCVCATSNGFRRPNRTEGICAINWKYVSADKSIADHVGIRIGRRSQEDKERCAHPTKK